MLDLFNSVVVSLRFVSNPPYVLHIFNSLCCMLENLFSPIFLFSLAMSNVFLPIHWDLNFSSYF